MATSSTPFHSARLIYRGPEPDSSEDLDLFLAIQQDPLGYQNSDARLSIPQPRASAKAFLKSVSEDALLGAVICIQTPSSADPPAPPVPIGVIHLDRLGPQVAHNRHADIGIDILKAYQGQGYGSEALRVGIRAFAWNEGAVRLYEKLGFTREGASRDCLWFQGKWWDDVQFGMLEHEWRAMQEIEAA
ncbi:hypothetical protein LTR53_011381 [Teratosphaeriaceae sp. CCFEE 6253]|nr:hypothetical protein LTR53_011381 [Teratosphaeriaceae sp. CCFEE 6253]